MKTYLILILGFLIPTFVCATKPTIPTEDMVQRSEIIAIAEIKSVRKIEGPKQDTQGNWLPQRFYVTASIVEALKNKIEGVINFEEAGLTFEPEEKCIIFLQKKNATFHYLTSPAKRMEATKGNVKEVKSCIEKQMTKK